MCASMLMMCEGTSARVHVSVAARRWLWLQFLGCHPLGFYSLGQGLTTWARQGSGCFHLLRALPKPALFTRALETELLVFLHSQCRYFANWIISLAPIVTLKARGYPSHYPGGPLQVHSSSRLAWPFSGHFSPVPLFPIREMAATSS